jgi:hypothetical protein
VDAGENAVGADLGLVDLNDLNYLREPHVFRTTALMTFLQGFYAFTSYAPRFPRT